MSGGNAGTLPIVVVALSILWVLIRPDLWPWALGFAVIIFGKLFVVRRHMKAFELLKSNHDRLVPLAERIVFDKTVPLDLHRMSLYGSLIEFVGGICTLLEKQATIGVSSLLRSFLEAYVDLENLLQDPGYVKNMEASNSAEWLKILKAAKAGGNPYLAGIEASPDLDEQIRKHETSIQNLKKEGRSVLNVFERFRNAKMEEEYRSLYNMLSSDAHSNMRALMGRHVEPTTKDFEVVYYKDIPLESFLYIVDTASGLLAGISEEIHSKYASPALAEVRQLREELATARREYAA